MALKRRDEVAAELCDSSCRTVPTRSGNLAANTDSSGVASFSLRESARVGMDRGGRLVVDGRDKGVN